MGMSLYVCVVHVLICVMHVLICVGMSLYVFVGMSLYVCVVHVLVCVGMAVFDCSCMVIIVYNQNVHQQ